jgi:hypothetical protein
VSLYKYSLLQQIGISVSLFVLGKKVMMLQNTDLRVIFVGVGHFPIERAIVSCTVCHILFWVSFLLRLNSQENIYTTSLWSIVLQVTPHTSPRATSFILRIALTVLDTITTQNMSS